MDNYLAELTDQEILDGMKMYSETFCPTCYWPEYQIYEKEAKHRGLLVGPSNEQDT